MKCPTCNFTMLCIAGGPAAWWHCPRCGTVMREGHKAETIVPLLAQNDYYLRWEQITEQQREVDSL